MKSIGSWIGGAFMFGLSASSPVAAKPMLMMCHAMAHTSPQGNIYESQTFYWKGPVGHYNDKRFGRYDVIDDALEETAHSLSLAFLGYLNGKGDEIDTSVCGQADVLQKMDIAAGSPISHENWKPSRPYRPSDTVIAQ